LRGFIELARGRWSGAEAGQLVSLFLAATEDVGRRFQEYELAQAFHGDESYRYLVEYDRTSLGRRRDVVGWKCRTLGSGELTGRGEK